LARRLGQATKNLDAGPEKFFFENFSVLPMFLGKLYSVPRIGCQQSNVDFFEIFLKMKHVGTRTGGFSSVMLGLNFPGRG
jgi:hypothetical protein